MGAEEEEKGETAQGRQRAERRQLRYVYDPAPHRRRRGRGGVQEAGEEKGETALPPTARFPPVPVWGHHPLPSQVAVAVPTVGATVTSGTRVAGAGRAIAPH
jgi:hypothetical protein